MSENSNNASSWKVLVGDVLPKEFLPEEMNFVLGNFCYDNIGKSVIFTGGLRSSPSIHDFSLIPVPHIYSFDIRRGEWKKLGELPESRDGCSLVVISRNLEEKILFLYSGLLFGGDEIGFKFDRKNDGFLYDLNNTCWERLSCSEVEETFESTSNVLVHLQLEGDEREKEYVLCFGRVHQKDAPRNPRDTSKNRNIEKKYLINAFDIEKKYWKKISNGFYKDECDYYSIGCFVGSQHFYCLIGLESAAKDDFKKLRYLQLEAIDIFTGKSEIVQKISRENTQPLIYSSMQCYKNRYILFIKTQNNYSDNEIKVEKQKDSWKMNMEGIGDEEMLERLSGKNHEVFGFVNVFDTVSRKWVEKCQIVLKQNSIFPSVLNQPVVCENMLYIIGGSSFIPRALDNHYQQVNSMGISVNLSGLKIQDYDLIEKDLSERIDFLVSSLLDDENNSCIVCRKTRIVIHLKRIEIFAEHNLEVLSILL